jgi:hypothetical protein
MGIQEPQARALLRRAARARMQAAELAQVRQAALQAQAATMGREESRPEVFQAKGVGRVKTRSAPAATTELSSV